MKKLLQMFVLTALGLIVLPRTAHACDCVTGRVLPPAQFSQSDVVFLGRVVQSQPLEYVEFEALETFNGRVDRRVRILTARSDCDYFLPPVVAKIGTQFLIYGTIHAGMLEVNRCQGSGPSNEKTRELEILRQRARPSVQSREAAQNVNLGRLESTRVSVSSVNGKREQDNPYYGAQNLVDGGRHLIDGINYTTWLSDQDASHWIRMEFRNPVDIKSIMFELTALDSRPTNRISDVDPATTRSSNPRRPEEIALDVVYADRDGRTRTDKLPSILASGFRSYYPLEKPLEAVVGLTLVFPGPSMVEVSEIEVMGTIP